MVTTMVKTMKASEFKAKCLQLMDEVAKTGDAIVITKNGKPVSRLVPVDERPQSLFGALKETVTIHGDIISPLDVAWEVEGAAARHARVAVGRDRKSGAGRQGKSGTRKGVR